MKVNGMKCLELNSLLQSQLIGHINSCLTDRTNNSISAALSWVQDLTECKGIVACQLRKRPSVSMVRFVNGTYSAAWIKEYIQQDFQRIDPVLSLAADRNGFNSWTTAFKSVSSIEKHNFLEAARDYGLTNGFVYSIPNHDPEGDAGIVTMCSISTEEKTLAWLASHIVQSLMPAIQVAISNCTITEPSPLSSRELEVLKWASVGKTAWETGRLLAISEATVKFHLSNVYRKLKVTTRAQALSHAILMGWL